MSKARVKAISIERRYRTLSKPWFEIIREIRTERGGLLASSEYLNLIGNEKSDALDKIDSRLKTAEAWLSNYEDERDKHSGFGVKKALKEIKSLSDEELEKEASEWTI